MRAKANAPHEGVMSAVRHQFQRGQTRSLSSFIGTEAENKKRVWQSGK
jgi:hypothetical protein